jgi:hypothetical protein
LKQRRKEVKVKSGVEGFDSDDYEQGIPDVDEV